MFIVTIKIMVIRRPADISLLFACNIAAGFSSAIKKVIDNSRVLDKSFAI